MSYTSYAGGSLAQDNARILFAERSRKAGALMRQGHSKQEAWAMITGKAPSVRAKKPRAKKAVAEGGATLGGAVLAGAVHHHRRHHMRHHM